MKVNFVYFSNRSENTAEIENCFIASKTPLYLGLIVKPSTGAWEYLKSAQNLFIREKAGTTLNFNIIYKIEVGENTIFFVTPDRDSSSAAYEAFL